jgi:uncharacterized protein YbjT (DUF2867 family)
MLLVMTPTGNSGRNVLKLALASTPHVRVLVRDASKLSPEVRATCEVVEGDLRDEAALAKASRNVRAAFFCLPLQSREPVDVATYHRSFSEPVAKALGAAGVERVVTISAGRGNPDDVGPNGPLARMERLFDEKVAATRHVRCGYFMENFLHVVPLLKFKSVYPLPLDGSHPLALEAAKDIGHEAGRWLVDATWSGHQGVDVPRGEILSGHEIASTMGRVLGKKIKYDHVSGADYKTMLIRSGGLSEPMAQSLKEMFEDIEHGTLNGKGKTKRPGGVCFESWARAELKPAMGFFSVMKRVLS